jgi:hypothetical protein
MASPNEEKRTPKNIGSDIDGPGPFLAKVKNHLDGEYMGQIEVELLKHNAEGNTIDSTGQVISVSYLSPFYGVTPYKGVTENDGNAYSQSSYGFWAVPPDIDTTVLVIFAEGNKGQGYWIGCVQDQYMNFMTPGRASTTYNSEETGQLRPTVEYNKRSETATGNNPTQFLKPIDQDMWSSLQRSGLQDDPIRGHTTSSARREVPSMVFGWSTPGPADWRDGSPRVSYGEEFSKTQVPFNRLGGHTFVMDDGDPNLYRTSAPTDGPSAYASLANGGDPLYPANDLMRLRTRSGHQILLHNSEDLVYIQHANGTSIEFTANGKIDIYAKDSVNVHATSDINIKADRNINMECGGDFNLKVGGDGKITCGGTSNITSSHHKETADRIDMNGPEAAPAASPTRVPQGGGWTGSENRNPAAHTPEQTDNVEGTSSPPVTGDGTTAQQTPEAAGETAPSDTFMQCEVPSETENNPPEETTTEPDSNQTKDESKATVTNRPGENR